MDCSNSSYLIGLDLGTTSIKALLLSSYGEVIATSGEEYALDYGQGETCEVEAEIYWEVSCRVLRSLMVKSGVKTSQVRGISFSSQGETIIVVGEGGKPLRKAIVWLDNRSEAEAEEIERNFGNQIIMNITGQPEILPIWPATRILWLKKNEPGIYGKVKKYLLVEDYIIYRMTGNYFTEHSLVSSTLYFDIRKKEWWKQMLDFLGISAEQLPELLPSGTRIQNITPEAAAATGLDINISVVTGSYDHPAGAIGAGNIIPGITTLTIGASMAMCVTIDKPINDLSSRLSCQCHALGGGYFLLPYAQTAGLLLKWFKDTFCQRESEISAQTGTDVYDLLTESASKIQPGAEGLLVLPHFMGAGSPYFNQKVRGVFAGITVGMTKGHFVRAILEAVASVVAHNIESVQKSRNIRISEIRFLGGGSKSPLWCQIIADMADIPVLKMSQNENASLGAAILAGLGSDIFQDFNEAAEMCIKVEKRFLPESESTKVYQRIYRNYKDLYNKMEDYWK